MLKPLVARVLAPMMLCATPATSAHAKPSDEASVFDSIAELERGDAHWFAGRRGRGARAWRRALRGADGDDPEHVSVRIRARARLLLAGSTFTPLVRVPPMQRDTLRCPAAEVACQLAFVDLYLLAPPTLGGSKAMAHRGATALEAALPGASAARLDLLDGGSRVELLPESTRDGLGQALAEGLDPAWRPGVSTFAAGVLLDPAYGVGGAVAARWPDAFRRQVVVGVTAGLATHGGYGALQVDVPTPWSLHLRARGHRARWWDPDAGAWAPASAGRVAVEVGPPLGDAFSARVGPVLRWDADLGGDPRPGHGLTAAVGWSTMRVWREPRGGRPGQRGGLSLGVRAETTLPGVSDYDGVVGVFQGVLLTPVADGELATRSYVQAAWGPSLPTTRTPFLGGPTLLRGAAFGDVRDDVVVLQSVELRHPVWRWLGLAVFGDVGAAVAKAPVVVPGGGVGLRVLPPPALGETVRLDVGVTPRGWQAYAGWGEAF